MDRRRACEVKESSGVPSLLLLHPEALNYLPLAPGCACGRERPKARAVRPRGAALLVGMAAGGCGTPPRAPNGVIGSKTAK